MLFIFTVLIRLLWQLKTVILLHRHLICALLLSIWVATQCQMGIKAKSRCHLVTLKVENFRHGLLDVIKLETGGPTGMLKNNH
jgi:hypothetical protein